MSSTTIRVTDSEASHGTESISGIDVRNAIFCLLPILGLAFQVGMLLASLPYVAAEDIREAVSSPFWLSQKTIITGAVNVGWYSLLSAWYSVVGVSFLKARLLRLLIHGLSLVCLVSVLRKTFADDLKKIVVVFLAIATSPTWLYYVTVINPNGFDLQIFPILVWLLLKGYQLSKEQRKVSSLVLFCAVGFLCMWSALAYPAGAFVIPALCICCFWQSDGLKQSIARFSIFLVGLTLPLLITLVYFPIPNQTLLGSLFRGGGEVGTFSWEDFFLSIRVVAGDLFTSARSYNFYLPRTEFVGLLGSFGFIATLSISIGSCLKGKDRSVARHMWVAAFFIAALTLVLPNIASTLPGLRRCTPLLAAFYICYVVASRKLEFSGNWAARIPTLALLLIPLHHLIELPRNIIEYHDLSETLAQTSWNEEKSRLPENILMTHDRSLTWYPWLAGPGSADDSLRRIREQVRAGGILNCRFKNLDCHYDGIYSALGAYEKWNAGASLDNVTALEFETGRQIQLNQASFTYLHLSARK